MPVRCVHRLGRFRTPEELLGVLAEVFGVSANRLRGTYPAAGESQRTR